MKKIELKVPPVAITLLSIGLMWAISVACPGASFPVRGGVILAGILAVIGGGIGLAGVSAFRRHETTVNPIKPESANSVVRDGVYRFTRNPMYLGLALFLAGCAVFFENAGALFVLPAFIAYMNRFQIGPEERVLLAKFGSSYSEYMSSVRRWV